MTDLPVWTRGRDGWRAATPQEKEEIEDAAECGGRCFVNDKSGRRVLCDGSDMILWSNKSWMEDQQ